MDHSSGLVFRRPQAASHRRAVVYFLLRRSQYAFRETLHKVYSDSSSAVHGGKLKYAAKDPKLVFSALDICRNGILKRLEETERPKWGEMILGARE